MNRHSTHTSWTCDCNKYDTDTPLNRLADEMGDIPIIVSEEAKRKAQEQFERKVKSYRNALKNERNRFYSWLK